MRKVLLGLVASAAMIAPAVGLDEREATVVVEIMEAYAAASGEPVYHGGAGEVFEYDMDGEDRISAAGFDFDSWTIAFDDVMTGYMASIPDAEFDAIFEAPLALLDANTRLTDEQKAVIREDLEPEIAAAHEARAGGAPFAAVVQPLLPRLHVLVFGQ
ncbi:MAG: hypothetical protein WBA73_16285 [Devosia sp.]